MHEDIFETLETSLKGVAVDPHHHALVLNSFTWDEAEESNHEDIFETLETSLKGVAVDPHHHALVLNSFTWDEEEQDA